MLLKRSVTVAAVSALGMLFLWSLLSSCQATTIAGGENKMAQTVTTAASRAARWAQLAAAALLLACYLAVVGTCVSMCALEFQTQPGVLLPLLLGAMSVIELPALGCANHGHGLAECIRRAQQTAARGGYRSIPGAAFADADTVESSTQTSSKEWDDVGERAERARRASLAAKSTD